MWVRGHSRSLKLVPIGSFGTVPIRLITEEYHSLTLSFTGTLDRPRGRSALQELRSCAILQAWRRWRWALCRPRSAAPTFGRVVHAGASTPARCPVYRLHECPQPGVVQSGLVSLPVVAARDQKWSVASDKIRIAKPSSPVWLVTEAFLTKWNQLIPKIRRWQFMFYLFSDKTEGPEGH